MLTTERVSWIVTKWIVDVYHQKVDPILHYTPAQMWTLALRQSPFLRDVPDNLLDVDFPPKTPGIPRAQERQPLVSGSLEL